MLRSVRATDGVTAERKAQVSELVADVRRLDAAIAAVKGRIVVAVEASKTSATQVYGVGPIVAAIIVGHSGDVVRFASRNHYASYNGTAPLEAFRGPRKRHRLNPRGNRQLNHAIHMAAVTQIRNDTPGRAYYERKVAEGKTKKEALRALKRRVSDAVYRQLLADAER
jgi:transposase